jgi:hypothetical protein
VAECTIIQTPSTPSNPLAGLKLKLKLGGGGAAAAGGIVAPPPRASTGADAAPGFPQQTASTAFPVRPPLAAGAAAVEVRKGGSPRALSVSSFWLFSWSGLVCLSACLSVCLSECLVGQFRLNCRIIRHTRIFCFCFALFFPNLDQNWILYLVNTRCLPRSPRTSFLLSRSPD